MREWSESFKKQAREWDYSLVYSHYLMFKTLKSLSASYETLHFASDLMVIDLERRRAVSASRIGSLEDRRVGRKSIPAEAPGSAGPS
jgi:hypothetical protein